MRFVCLAPICLPEKNEDFLGKFGWAAGWGALNPGSRLRPKTLQAVDVPVIENRYVLRSRWPYFNNFFALTYLNLSMTVSQFAEFVSGGIVRMV